MDQKVRRLANRLKFLKHLDESERLLYARSLLATPDERWERNRQFLRSHGLLKLSDREKRGFKLPG